MYLVSFVPPVPRLEIIKLYNYLQTLTVSRIVYSLKSCSLTLLFFRKLNIKTGAQLHTLNSVKTANHMLATDVKRKQ